MKTLNRAMRILCFGAAVALLARPAGAQAMTGRIGFVRGQTLLRATPGFAHADSQYTKDMEGYQAEMTHMRNKLDSAGARFQETSPMLSSVDRTAAQKRLEALQDSATKLQTDLQDRAAQREQELMSPLTDRIGGVIEGLRAEMNLDAVLDLDVLQRAVVSYNKSLDLTQKAIDRLGGPATPAPKKPGGQ
ncbi:MAG TPA: OmpH family outer membrane protein [Gemmatimonadales bacterium]|jgi:outer membrane protein|nr:OmpH family outer membrane protein [Gemmatimonadales bacterium]